MISKQLTRADLADSTGLKGKELTQWIRKHMASGDLIRQFSFTEPSRSRRRELRYNLIARSGELFERT